MHYGIINMINSTVTKREHIHIENYHQIYCPPPLADISSLSANRGVAEVSETSLM